jgi:signal transduction histidine kinase
MPPDEVDPRWSKILSLAVHEFRTPITVVAGYLRMVLKERAGPVSDQQRRLLEEAEKSCARLSALLTEVSDLSGLEARATTFNHASVDLQSVLNDVIVGLPELPDRQIHVEFQPGSTTATVQGDKTRLKAALVSVLVALRRELVTSDRLFVRELVRQYEGREVAWIAIGDADRITTLADADASALTTFDEWRGGCGLSLPVARRVINAHGGRIWSPVEDTKAGAAIAIPLSPGASTSS